MTMNSCNEFGQPVGPSLGEWAGASRPAGDALMGNNVTLVPLDPVRHVSGLHTRLAAGPLAVWTYMSAGPFDDEKGLFVVLKDLVDAPNSEPYAVILADGTVSGFLAYLAIDAPRGSIEIGWIMFSADLQQTTGATEALYLLMAHAFHLGYRRLEWKCDSLNARSLAAARRLGFVFEGVFRKHLHYKGRNRDTAWLSITDEEWPLHDQALCAWLNPDNFDKDGRQRRSLGEFRK